MASNQGRRREPTNSATLMMGIVLASMPVVSFLLQYAFSIRAGTQPQFFRHFTVAYVDWIFVPFNFVVVRAIDWKRGSLQFALMIFSVVANIAAHASWQYNLLDGGHMITPSQVILPAGWVHLGFSIAQMTLLLMFIFSREPVTTRWTNMASSLAIAYFLMAGSCGYLMHHKFLPTDIVMALGGMLLVIGYPIIDPSHRHVVLPERIATSVLSDE